MLSRAAAGRLLLRAAPRWGRREYTRLSAVAQLDPTIAALAGLPLSPPSPPPLDAALPLGATPLPPPPPLDKESEKQGDSGSHTSAER
eukprot:scaffold326301_cov68-Tisochrysis_lutea.AAC.1